MLDGLARFVRRCAGASDQDEMTRPAGKRPQRTLDTSNPYNQ